LGEYFVSAKSVLSSEVLGVKNTRNNTRVFECKLESKSRKSGLIKCKFLQVEAENASHDNTSFCLTSSSGYRPIALLQLRTINLEF